MELLNNDDNENNKPELKMEYSYKLKDGLHKRKSQKIFINAYLNHAFLFCR